VRLPVPPRPGDCVTDAKRASSRAPGALHPRAPELRRPARRHLPRHLPGTYGTPERIGSRHVHRRAPDSLPAPLRANRRHQDPRTVLRGARAALACRRDRALRALRAGRGEDARAGVHPVRGDRAHGRRRL
jgi:hypothetical protein